MMERAEYWAKFFSENNIRKSYFEAMLGSGGSRQMESEESHTRSIPGRGGVRQMSTEQIDTNDSYVGSIHDRGVRQISTEQIDISTNEGYIRALELGLIRGNKMIMQYKPDYSIPDGSVC